METNLSGHPSFFRIFHEIFIHSIRKPFLDQRNLDNGPIFTKCITPAIVLQKRSCLLPDSHVLDKTVINEGLEVILLPNSAQQDPR